MDFRFSYFVGKTSTRYHINHQFLKNAQGCQLGTLQILILQGLMISNQSKPIVGPLLQGYLKLLPDYGASLQGKATEIWCLFRILPLLISEYIPVDDAYWNLFLKCRSIADYLFASAVTDDDIDYHVTNTYFLPNLSNYFQIN